MDVHETALPTNGHHVAKVISHRSVRQVLEKYEAALLLLLGFGGFSVLLAIAYNSIRRYVFRDVRNLDSSFDAGGRVTTSLTAVTVGVQLLWPADLLQSATVTAKVAMLDSNLCTTRVSRNRLWPRSALRFSRAIRSDAAGNRWSGPVKSVLT